MTTLDEILGAFEEALELERELGTRTVECDRALLMPVTSPPSPPSPTKPETRNLEPSKPRNLETSKPETRNLETSKPETAQPSELKDFAYIVDKKPEGEAAEMMRKMLRAMGCSNRDSVVREAANAAAQRPNARVYIVLGREAFQAFAPGQRAALGMWTKVADVPTVVTYSPAKILACFGSEGDGITKAKRQLWSDLKSALALLGRTPVNVKR